MDALFSIWKNLDGLRSLSSYLQWISISLVFFGGALQVAKYIVDRREKEIASAIQTQKEQSQVERESHLLDKVGTLEGDLARRQSEIDDLHKKTQFVDPFTQPIRTATATVEVVIESSENVNAHFIDQGGWIAFGKGQQAIMAMSSIDCFGKQLGGNQVLYRGVFNMDATDKAIGKPISTLTDADFAQIGFGPIPAKSRVVRGSAICTFNSAVRVELNVPLQQMGSNFIVVPEVKKAFKDYTK